MPPGCWTEGRSAGPSGWSTPSSCECSIIEHLQGWGGVLDVKGKEDVGNNWVHAEDQPQTHRVVEQSQGDECSSPGMSHTALHVFHLSSY